jgi:hypothetical protein
MAQKQYTTYQNDVLSYDLRDALVGVIQPGRYKGFDNMTEYQAQSGSNVYIEISNTNGQNKYDGDGVDPPPLDAERGIAVTTQGVIIADDFSASLQETIALIDGAVNGVYHLLYMEHIYDDANPGANNATYGWIHGADNDTPPTLTNPTKRVIIGYIYEPISASLFADLVWYPAIPVLGDVELTKDLFKYDANGVRIYKGTIPADGIIGDRSYGSPVNITNYESLTDSLKKVDDALVAEVVARVAIGNRSPDDPAWGNFAESSTVGDVDDDQHGFCPGLPDDVSKFLNGFGNWAVPPGGRFVMRTGAFSTDVTIGSPIATNPISLTGVGGCPSDADVLIIRLRIDTAALPAGNYVKVAIREIDSGGFHAEHRINNMSAGAITKIFEQQVTVPCDSNQDFYAEVTEGLPSIGSIYITLVGWQTYTP